jgi:predicted nuclease of restriction endonuclease-like (RecB) superfamily
MTPANYISVLNTLKEKIKKARTQAALSVNSHLLTTYWEIGSTILQQQKEEGWGSKVIDRLANDLRLEFPGMQGLSIRNFKYMRTFAEAYPHFPNVQAPLAQTTDNSKELSKVQAPLAQLSWYHHITLITKVKDPQIRLFYADKTIENGWSRDIMVHQIESNLHIRQGALTTNFKNTVPSQQSELVQQIFKDPYNFDFLQLSEEAKERDLENALTQYITKLLLELGDGFAFKGRQFSLEADGQEYFLDLLFYHTKLRRHIAIELKIGDFQPEFTGKMNFYLGLLDDKLKGKYDEPSIGLILCKTKSKIIAEYALRDTSKPIGIAEYRLAESLPDDIRGELPSIEEIEQKLDEELKENLRPADVRLMAIKEKLKAVQGDEIQTQASFPILNKLYTDGLAPLYRQLLEKLSDFDDIFHSKSYSWSGPQKAITSFEDLNELWNDEAQLRNVPESIFYYSLWGFKKGGTRNFNESQQLKLSITTYWYGFTLVNHNNNEPFIKKLYHQPLTLTDRQFIVDTLIDKILDKIDWFIKEMGDSEI